MANIFLVILVFILSAVLIWLSLEYIKLKRALFLLSANVERNNKDIAGICSAAISVDNKVYNNRELLVEIADRVDEASLCEQEFNPPYYSAIQRIKEGATAEELIRQYGLSHEEVDMLIRLHR
jgi:hypothetical protein